MAIASMPFTPPAHERGFRVTSERLPAARIAIGAYEEGVRPVRLGFQGAVIQRSGHDEVPAGAGMLELDTEGETLMVPCLVNGARADDRMLAVRFMPLSLELARKLARWIGQQAREIPTASQAPLEQLVEPERIRALMMAFRANERLLRVRHDKFFALFELLSLEGDELQCRLCDSWGSLPSRFWVDVSGYSGIYVFSAELMHERDGLATLKVPEQVTHYRHRSLTRAVVKDAWHVVFNHPVLSATSIDRPVRDVSAKGLGLDSWLEEDFLDPGMYLPDVLVRGPEGETIALAAFVRRVRFGAARTLSQVGLEVFPRTPADKSRWDALVERTVHRSTRTFPDHPSELWDLYAKAGYLNLSGTTPEAFERVRDAFESTSTRLARTPELGCQIVWPSEDGILATTSMLRAYRATWLGLHMAKVPGKRFGDVVGKQILRDLHWHVFEHALTQQPSRWMVAYVQVGTRFTEMMLPDYQDRIAGGEQCVVPFVAFGVSLAELDLGPSTLRVREGAHGDLRALQPVLNRLYPQPFLLAHDLDYDNFHLDEIQRLHKRAGFSRARSTRVIEDQSGRSLAMVIVEHGEPGLHLYGLFDLVRIVPMQGASLTLEQEQAGLLAAAEYFRALGRDTFTYFREHAEYPLEVPGTRDMGPARCSVLSSEHIPELFDYLFERLTW